MALTRKYPYHPGLEQAKINRQINRLFYLIYLDILALIFLTITFEIIKSTFQNL